MTALSLGLIKTSTSRANISIMPGAPPKVRAGEFKKQFANESAGPTDFDYLNLEQLADTTTQFRFNLQRSVEDPIINFANVIGKIS